jgi:hypothetical protein
MRTSISVYVDRIHPQTNWRFWDTSVDRIYSITLLFWILFAVWSQILLATYTRWVLDTASHSLLGRIKLYGFELVATILATVICVSTLLDLDAKNIESRISPGCILFFVVPVLLAAVDYPRTWRRYVSCLIIVASL